jgi:predicted nucleic acid-binding protein
VSDEFVVDAAAIIDALTRKDAVGIVLAQRITAATCHAPHLIDAEVGHVLRRIVRLGQIPSDLATVGLSAMDTLIDERYVHTGWLASEAWHLRDTITFYDALYVALAARLDIPLLTGDAKLSKAPGLPCKIELIT